MENLHVLVGLPRSGKSTLSKTLGFPIVECDAIRKALGCFPFVPEREPEVWRIAHLMVGALFFAGHEDVILDSTCHTEKRREEWSAKYNCVFHTVKTDKDTCIERAKRLGQDYLVPVIEGMASEITWPKAPEGWFQRQARLACEEIAAWSPTKQAVMLREPGDRR